MPCLSARQQRLVAAEQARADDRREHQIIGAPEQVKAQLEALVAAVDADELSILSITHDFGRRKRCYELIAEAFGLAAG